MNVLPWQELLLLPNTGQRVGSPLVHCQSPEGERRLRPTMGRKGEQAEACPYPGVPQTLACFPRHQYYLSPNSMK